jgi:hypothetical protein
VIAERPWLCECIPSTTVLVYQRNMSPASVNNSDHLTRCKPNTVQRLFDSFK